LPWRELHTGRIDPNAFSSEDGVFLVVAYIALSLFLSATYSGDPVRAWKPAILLAAGLLILAVLCVYQTKALQLAFASAYCAFACAIGLLVVGAIQVRQILSRRKEGPS
jgi:hypothetical protein